MKPKFTLSKSTLLNKYNELQPLADYISYSSKTNPLVTSILEQNTNSMFSIHLINELKNIKDKSRILFLAQAWNKETITTLLNQGITWFVVDNESDLNIFTSYLATNNIDKKINLLLRLRLRENTLRTEKFFVFGMKAKTIINKIEEIKNNNIIINKIQNLGIHFHRKTQNMAEWNYQYEISNIIPEYILKQITIINMGGGLPSNYANTNINVIKSIKTKITEFKNHLHNYNIKLMLEPGRFIAAPAGKLHATIMAIYENNIIINASVYNSDMDALIVPVKLLVEGEQSKDTSQSYVIKGITPCSLDLFRYRIYLNNPQVGQQLTFLNAGAYNFTTEFCNLDKIETEVVE
jgi:ornithine decarboxylase